MYVDKPAANVNSQNNNRVDMEKNLMRESKRKSLKNLMFT